MRKGLILLLIISVLLTGCGQKNTQVDPFHNFYTKTFLMNYPKLEQFIDDYENQLSTNIDVGLLLDIYKFDKEFLSFLAINDLKYHFQWGSDEAVASAYGAATNLSYNISYILNIPAKLKMNYQFNKKFVDGDLDPGLMKDIRNFVDGFEDVGFWVLTLYDLFYAISGVTLAFIMIPVGAFFGFLNHPIKTFLDIPTAFSSLIDGGKYAFSNLFD